MAGEPGADMIGLVRPPGFAPGHFASSLAMAPISLPAEITFRIGLTQRFDFKWMLNDIDLVRAATKAECRLNQDQAVYKVTPSF